MAHRWDSLRVVILLIAVGGVVAPVAPPAGASTLAELSDAFEELSGQIGPAVVQIFSTRFEAAWLGETTGDLLSQRRSTGSGVILSADGYIVTNAHVVRGGRRVQVVVQDPEASDRRSILKGAGRTLGAQIVGIDLETDLAVLKVPATDLPALVLADSDGLRQGELVMAFGSPLGLENSVSFGVVSSVARQLRDEDPMIYVQTDAAINPGNSGGPLVDTNGQVVGINTFILSQSGGNEGIGFAAPSNIVRNVFEQIRDTGVVRRGEIGVHAQTITPMLAAGLGLERSWGVVLGDVTPGSPAAIAGLEAGDVVLELDGKPMENGRQLDVNVYARKIGERVALNVERGGKKRSVQVVVRERATGPHRFADLVSPERNLIPVLGVLGLTIEAELTPLLPQLRDASGVLVAAVAADAPAGRGGLAPGDVIHTVNRQRVASVRELQEALARADKGRAVVLHVEREGRWRFVAFEHE